MANKFIGDKDFGVVGKVHTIVKKPDGEIRFELEQHNSVQADLKNRLCAAIKLGTFNAISNFATVDGSVTTNWSNRDGILVFNTANSNQDGTLLKCVATNANTVNSLVIQGTNSLFDDSTMSAFCLGTSVDSNTKFNSNYFIHEPDQFAYSSGDTITVNWTISIT